jgi:hypothetical protein
MSHDYYWSATIKVNGRKSKDKTYIMELVKEFQTLCKKDNGFAKKHGLSEHQIERLYWDMRERQCGNGYKSSHDETCDIFDLFDSWLEENDRGFRVELDMDYPEDGE